MAVRVHANRPSPNSRRVSEPDRPDFSWPQTQNFTPRVVRESNAEPAFSDTPPIVMIRLFPMTSSDSETLPLLLLIAFRHTIDEADVEAAFERIRAIAGGKLDVAAFHEALASGLRDRLIREPVRLEAGSLQCHWHLELTPEGVEAVRALLRERGTTADQLLGQTTLQI